MYTCTYFNIITHALACLVMFPAYKLIDIMDHKRDHGDKMD